MHSCSDTDIDLTYLDRKGYAITVVVSDRKILLHHDNMFWFGNSSSVVLQLILFNIKNIVVEWKSTLLFFSF